MSVPEIDAYLESGERVLWTAPAPRGLIVRLPDLIFGPFVVVWSGFALFQFAMWMPPAISKPTEALGQALLMPFVLVALYLFPGRYILDALERQRTIYAITDRRAIILSELSRGRAQSRAITKELKVAFTRPWNGVRSLLIGPQADKNSWLPRYNMFTRKHCHPFCFERIPNALAAYKIIRKVQTGRV